MSSKRLRHTIDMLLGLAERLALLAVVDPAVYLAKYKAIMQRVEKEEHPMKRGMTQADKILFLLRKGSKLTKLELMVHHKIATPTARITELRERGHKIKSLWKECPIDGTKYVEYALSA